MPPWEKGLPVVQAMALMSSGCRLRYVSAIQAISRSPVPISGAGTLRAGLIYPLFDQFLCKTSGNELEFMLVVFSGINAQATFGTAKGHIDDRAFVRHECGERFYVILADCGCVTDASFDGQAMLAVNRAPSRERCDRCRGV